MAESMKDFERELEASFKRIDEGDIISGTVVSVMVNCSARKARSCQHQTC